MPVPLQHMIYVHFIADAWHILMCFIAYIFIFIYIIVYYINHQPPCAPSGEKGGVQID